MLLDESKNEKRKQEIIVQYDLNVYIYIYDMM